MRWPNIDQSRWAKAEAMALLDIEHLAFHVAGQAVLADVAMTVGEREIHALARRQRHRKNHARLPADGLRWLYANRGPDAISRPGFRFDLCQSGPLVGNQLPVVLNRRVRWWQACRALNC